MSLAVSSFNDWAVATFWQCVGINYKGNLSCGHPGLQQSRLVHCRRFLSALALAVKLPTVARSRIARDDVDPFLADRAFPFFACNSEHSLSRASPIRFPYRFLR